MHRGNKTNFYVSSPSPPFNPARFTKETYRNRRIFPSSFPPHFRLPRVYLTSRYKIHFIATGRTNRYFSFLGNPINERREDCNRRRDAINGCRCGEGVDTCFVTSKGDACVTHACVIRQVSVPRCLPTCIGAGRHVLTRSIIPTNNFSYPLNRQVFRNFHKKRSSLFMDEIY